MVTEQATNTEYDAENETFHYSRARLNETPSPLGDDEHNRQQLSALGTWGFDNIFHRDLSTIECVSIAVPIVIDTLGTFAENKQKL